MADEAARAAEANPALARFRTWLRVERGLSPRTVEAYGRDVRDWLLATAGEAAATWTGFGEVTPAQLRAWIRSRLSSLDPRSQARKRSALRTFYRFLLRSGMVDGDPTAGLAVPRQPKRLPRTQSAESLVGWLRALSEIAEPTPIERRDAALFWTLYGCGLRVSELSGLDLDRLDRLAGVLRVRGKGNKERIVPLPAAVLEVVDRWLAVRGEVGAKPGSRRCFSMPPAVGWACGGFRSCWRRGRPRRACRMVCIRMRCGTATRRT